MERANCQKCQLLFDQQWDGQQLAQEDSDFVQSHLGTCLTCASMAHDMGKILAAAENLSELTYGRPVELAPLVLGRRKSIRPIWRALATGTVFGAALVVSFSLGKLVSPPAALQQVGSASATQQVVVRVAVPIAGAESVSLLGDFTGWKNKIPLSRSESGLWVGELRVPAGRYRYVLVIDDTQMQPDPAAPQVVDDGFGGKNSVLDVSGTL